MFKVIGQLFKKLTQVNPNLNQDVDLIVQAIGGLENIVDSGACATRLRLTLKSTTLIDQQALKQHGALGVVCLDERHVQIIYGLQAASYSQEIEDRLKRKPRK